MNLHKHARTTPHSRRLMVHRVLDEKQPTTRVAADFGVSERTVRKWLARWRAGGEPALTDLSSAPARQRRLPAEQVAAIEALRRQERIPGAEGLFDPERHPGGRTALRLTRSEAAGPRSTTLASRAILSFLFERHGREER
jgi:transposase-like protein